MTKFSVAGGVSKRPLGDHASSANIKIPRAGDVQIAETRPATLTTPRRLPTAAPVIVCICKVTDAAGDVWEAYNDRDHKLFQIQIDHAAQRPITFQMRDCFNDFLRSAHADNDVVPNNLRDLEDTVGVRLIVSDRADPDRVGFVPWRVGFYITGDVNNFLHLLDDWFVFKAKATARERPFEVHIFPHVGVELKIADQLQYEHYSISEPAAELPLSIFECQPVVGKRIICLNIQVENESVISVVITGNTWAYRQRLDAFGVVGGYTDADDKDKRAYFRIWKSLDVSDESMQVRFLEMLDNAVFRNLAMRVTVDSPANDDTAVAEFITKLREQPSLYFDKQSHK